MREVGVEPKTLAGEPTNQCQGKPVSPITNGLWGNTLRVWRFRAQKGSWTARWVVQLWWGEEFRGWSYEFEVKIR